MSDYTLFYDELLITYAVAFRQVRASKSRREDNGMQKNREVECLRSCDEVDERIGFKYRIVYMHSEKAKLHYHDYYEIILILAPGTVHYINGTKEELSRGTLLFIRKEDVHTFKYSVVDECTLCNLTFSEEILKDLLQFLGAGYPSDRLFSETLPPKVVLEEEEISWVLRQMDHLNAIEMGEILTLSYRCRLFLLKIFTRYLITAVSSHTKVGPDWLEELCVQMRKLENFSVGNERMIELSGRSKEHLGRVLKKYYGVTISEYINNLRLNFFANTLVNSDMPIIDICFECGYGNVSYAYRQFKKQYGISPQKYRRTHQ